MKLFIVMVSLFHVVKLQGKYVYIYICSVCGLQYIDESKQPFHKRLNGHKSDLTNKTFLPVRHHSRLSDNSLEDFNRMKKSSSLNIAVCEVIFNVRIG